MLSFVDNWMQPFSLSASATEGALDLPQGIYVLTMADSSSAATRWEVLYAEVADGQAFFQRPAPQEWPEGSVIYCAVNAMVLGLLFDGLTQLGEQISQVGEPEWQQVYGAFAGGVVTLEKSNPHWIATPNGGMVTLVVPSELPAGKRIANTAEVNLNAGGKVRITGGGREIIAAQVQPHPSITSAMGPGNAYIELTAAATFVLRLTIAARAAEYPDTIVRLRLVVDITDLDSGYNQLA
jgi:hypothetical protein|tara:strand:+ start:4528 stop:5241 length:714 start_codon:yes stop_codon:yes gene_type:complete